MTTHNVKTSPNDAQIKQYANGAINTFTFTEGTSAQIVALPHSGGNAVAYQQLAKHFSYARFTAVDCPGHVYTKGNLFDDADKLCEYLIEHLPDSLFSTYPLILMGTSLGGYLACTLASLIKRHYQIDATIVMLSTPPLNRRDQHIDLYALPADELSKLLMYDHVGLNSHFENIIRADLKIFNYYRMPENITQHRAIIIGGYADKFIAPHLMYGWHEYFSNSSVDFIHGTHLLYEHGETLEHLLTLHNLI